MKGFATPDIVEEKKFHETVVDGGLMLDRTRIYRYTTNGCISNCRKVWLN